MPPLDDACDPACVADPAPHALVTHGCLHSGECPAGTSCITLAEPDPAAACNAAVDGRPETWSCATCARGDAVSTKVCAVTPPSSSERTALRRFGAEGAIALDPITATGGTGFQVTAPDGTLTVECALFGCLPSIDDADGALRIANFDACVLGSRLFVNPDPVFDPAVAAALPAPRVALTGAVSAEVCPVAEAHPVLTRLVAGCWGYDSTRLSAVSDLVPVPLTAGAAFLRDCGADDDVDWSCALGAEADDGFGRCGVDHRCHRRCVVDADCTAAGPGSVCIPQDGRYVGSCTLGP